MNLDHPFRIGAVSLVNRTVLAPLAGITNLPLRLLAKDAGCGLVCSEMISANGLIHNGPKTWRLLESTPSERPLSVQIFGADPGIMADAAQRVAAAGADILDINFGCSVKKVVKTGSGAALMRTPGKAREVLRAVRNGLSIPLTIKIRSGWEPSGAEALHLARMAEDCGVDAITVHPRTATQGFRGHADRSLISRIKRAVSIPVIGNGDIQTSADALAMRKETGCDAVMVGRAAIGAPWIFSDILAMERGEAPAADKLPLRFQAMARYLRASVEYFGEAHACHMMRSRLGWFVKGLPHNGCFRESIKRVSTEAEAMALIHAYRAAVMASADRESKPHHPTEREYV
jgi:tRNA-dihydrouridine synthase B